MGWGPLYVKREWRELDQAIFTRHRSDKDMKLIAESFARQWAAARELPEYNENNWQFMYQLAFNPPPPSRPDGLPDRDRRSFPVMGQCR